MAGFFDFSIDVVLAVEDEVDGGDDECVNNSFNSVGIGLLLFMTPFADASGRSIEAPFDEGLTGGLVYVEVSFLGGLGEYFKFPLMGSGNLALCLAVKMTEGKLLSF